MSKQRFPEEFKTEAVKQITERGHKVSEVAARLGVSQHSLYQWIKARRTHLGERQAQLSQTEELTSSHKLDSPDLEIPAVGGSGKLPGEQRWCGVRQG